MKKGLVILFALFLLTSCRDKDDENTTVVTYGVTIEKICNGVQSKYCITKATYDYLNALPFTGSPCNWISIKDIDGNSVSGYLRSWGSPCEK